MIYLGISHLSFRKPGAFFFFYLWKEISLERNFIPKGKAGVEEATFSIGTWKGSQELYSEV